MRKRIVDVHYRRMLLVCVSLYLCIFLQACFGNINCSEDVIKEVASPSGKFVAVVMRRNCHATTPFVTHINLRKSNESFVRNPETNEIAEGMVLSVVGEFPVELEWTSENALKLRCQHCLKSDVIRKPSKWNEVEVTHEFPEVK